MPVGIERTLKIFKEALDRNYVHIKFTGTQGGTELGVRLTGACVICGRLTLKQVSAQYTIAGSLTLDYVKARCIADLDLKTVERTSHLEKVGVQS